MKKRIFTFFIFCVLLIFISSCYSSRKGGCDCPGMSEKDLKEIKKDS